MIKVFTDFLRSQALLFQPRLKMSQKQIQTFLSRDQSACYFEMDLLTLD